MGSLANISAKIFHTPLIVSCHASMGSRRNRVVPSACSTVLKILHGLEGEQNVMNKFRPAKTKTRQDVVQLELAQ